MSKKWFFIGLFSWILSFSCQAQSKSPSCAYLFPFSEEDSLLLREILIHLNYHKRVVYKKVAFARCGEFRDEICIQRVDTQEPSPVFKVSESGLLSYLYELDQLNSLNLKFPREFPVHLLQAIRF